MPAGLATAALSCPKNVNISGGSFTLSNGWNPGSILTYSCPLGHYPYPVATRLCKSNGQWQIPRSTRSTKAICKREAPCQRPPWGLLFSLLSMGLNVTLRVAKLLFHRAFQNSKEMSTAHSKALEAGYDGDCGVLKPRMMFRGLTICHTVLTVQNGC